ncbi:teichoic acid synthase, partial [Burkholderia multivorans]
MIGPGAGDRARAVLRDRGISTHGKKVICYAPTWRGGSFYNPQSDAGRLKATVMALRSALEDEGWIVLLKAHQVIVDQLVDDPELADFLVPNDVPANDVLAITDILVSDYSSIFIDFLGTGRPVLFHLPDAGKYAAERGTYLRPDELPGPVSESIDELLDQATRLAEDDVDLSSAFP